MNVLAQTASLAAIVAAALTASAQTDNPWEGGTTLRSRQDDHRGKPQAQR